MSLEGRRLGDDSMMPFQVTLNKSLEEEEGGKPLSCKAGCRCILFKRHTRMNKRRTGQLEAGEGEQRRRSQRKEE